jgi:hypothetical protein
MPNVKPKPDVADALQSTLISPNEADSNSEPANVVDGLFAIARAIDHLADAIESGGKPVKPAEPYQWPPREYRPPL